MLIVVLLVSSCLQLTATVSPLSRQSTALTSDSEVASRFPRCFFGSSNGRQRYLNCNVCTTQNYFDCCRSRRNNQCCKYVNECPAPSNIVCLQFCANDSCPSGQTCCPINRMRACCAPTLATTTTLTAATTSATTSASG